MSTDADWWKQLIHPDDVSLVQKAFDEHLEGRAPHFEAEERMLTKSGEWKWISDRGTVVECDDEGNPTRVAGFLIDITDRMRAEGESRRLAEEWKMTFDSMPITGEQYLLHENDKTANTSNKMTNAYFMATSLFLRKNFPKFN